jgi:hypothetical protein
MAGLTSACNPDGIARDAAVTLRHLIKPISIRSARLARMILTQAI